MEQINFTVINEASTPYKWKLKGPLGRISAIWRGSFIKPGGRQEYTAMPSTFLLMGIIGSPYGKWTMRIYPYDAQDNLMPPIYSTELVRPDSENANTNITIKLREQGEIVWEGLM